MDTPLIVAKKIIPARLVTPKSGPRSVWFGPELGQLREGKNETLLVAAVAMEMNPSTLQRLEKGLRGAKPKLVKAIENHYTVTVDIAPESGD